jgi:nitrite reductase/ring-hydroxylating ferredoxin subunit
VKEVNRFFSIENIRKSKPFKICDLIVYAALILFVAALFLYFIILPTINTDTVGFCVSKGGKTVLTVKNLTCSVNDEFVWLVESEKVDENLRVTIFTDQTKLGYNVIIFYANGSAKVVESTCSHSKDCTFSPAIKNSGVIYCAPHDLKIEPLTGSGFIPPVAGGGA